VARGVSAALNNVVNCLPGQRVVEDAIEEINAASQLLNAPDIKVCLKRYILILLLYLR